MNLLEVNLDKLISILGTDLSLGLTGEQVLRNRREFGENVLRETPRTASALTKKIFGDVMMIIFLATGLFDYLSNRNLASLIGVLFASALYSALIFGSFLYARHVNGKVEKFSRSKIHVRRNGRVATVSKRDLVPGDILILEKGDVMPCDGVILDAKSLRVLEASVTGQRMPMIKRSHEEVRADEKYPYFECVLFAGTVILNGSARVFVCNTGKDVFDSENFTVSRQNGTVSRIRDLAMELKKELQLIWVLACFIIFAWGVFREQDVFQSFYFSAAMVIAAFPASIEYFCDLATAYMTDRLFREGVILRNPGAIDHLCDANCIFVNSADYLFYAKPLASLYHMGDREYDFRVDHVPAKPLLEDLLLAEMTPAYWEDPRNAEERKGEKVIEAAAARCGLQKRRLDHTFMHINRADPDPERRFSCALVLCENGYRLVVRGEPEKVLSLCSQYRSGSSDHPLTPVAAMLIRSAFRRIAGNCERIVAAAELSLSSPPEGDLPDHCREMTYIGALGLSTPVSAAAAKEVNSCEKCGINTYLLTDDYPEMVETLSKSVSIIKENDYQYVLRYDSYQRMDRGVFVADVERYKAYSLFPPEEKQNIVRYHKENGDITVSLTGGISDMLPQMESDISIVSAEEKSAAVRLNADILMREKKFDLVPLCINWARILYQNTVHIMQFILLLQVTLCFSVVLGLTLGGEPVFPLLPMIFVCLGAALPCAFNIFYRKPGPVLAHNSGVLKDRIYSLQVLIIMPAIAGLVGAIAVTLSRQIALYATGNSYAASGEAILTMAFSAWFASLSMKTERSVFKSLREIGRIGLISFLIMLAVTLIAVYSPFAALYNPAYGQFGAGLSPVLGFVAFILSLLPMFAMEWMKFLKKDDEPVPVPRRANFSRSTDKTVKKVKAFKPHVRKRDEKQEEPAAEESGEDVPGAGDAVEDAGLDIDSIFDEDDGDDPDVMDDIDIGSILDSVVNEDKQDEKDPERSKKG